MEQKLTKTSYWIILALTFALPLWTIPGVAGSVAQHKLFLFVLSAGVLALIWAARTVVSKRVWLSLSPVNLALMGAAGATAVSAVLATNPIYQLSGRFLAVAAAALILLFATTLTPRLKWPKLLQLFLWSGTLLSLFTWLQLTPLSPSTWMNQILGTALPEGLQYSLADNHLLLMSFLFPVGLAGLAAGLTSIRKTALGPALLKGPLPWSLVCLITAGTALGLTLTRPELGIAFLPYDQGWKILVENFKSLRQVAFGVGPESFGVAFHRFRDVSFNSLPIWNVRFAASSSEFLQTATTAGILGLGLWLSLFVFLIDGARRVFKKQPSLSIFLLLHVAAFFLLPLNLLLTFSLTIGLIALSNHLQEDKPGYVKEIIFLLSAVRIAAPGALKSMKTQAGFSLVTALISAALAITGLFFAGRVYAGSFYFELARQAAAMNLVRETYNYQQAAARFHSRNPGYRRAYSVTNLNLAKGLATSVEELDEEQRALVSRLLQQAIREARLAALLNPAETENWEVLANIYATILDVEGSGQWAIASMVQAIMTDPISPVLRLNLGNLYLVIGQNDQALRLIEQAIQLKPDFANTYISYGTALEKRDEPALAAQAYQRAIDLLGPDFDGLEQLREKVSSLQAIAADRARAQEQADAALEQSIPDPGEPSVPHEQPVVQNPPDEFGAIVEGRDPQAEQDSAEPKPVVLPSDIGF